MDRKRILVSGGGIAGLTLAIELKRRGFEPLAIEHEPGLAIRYGASLAALDDRGDAVYARFEDAGEDAFALVIGADGLHSRVRELAFGPEGGFARFLGLHIAAFHVPSAGFPIGRKIKLYEEADHFAFLYPLSETQLDATFCFRHAAMTAPHHDRIGFLREEFRNTGWITRDIVAAYPGGEPIYFDSVTQIEMRHWYKGRIALIGDACGCLTLLAGQDSHMAMAGA
jgi:2-polyprenyl-6-methoxyphenol hydroxylase-like FAD-dependent oxidoreductase